MSNQRPPTACRIAGCSGYAATSGYCAECLKENPQAGELAKPFLNLVRKRCPLYDTARWRKPGTGLRAAALRKYPVCDECKCRASEVVDHRIDHHCDPVLFFDFNNLRGLCADCHNAKTLAQHGRGKREPDKPALVNGLVKEYGG